MKSGLMFDLLQNTEKRIGEILVIGSSNSSHDSFLYSICPRVMKSDQDIIFGQLQIEQDLSLFLYGISSNGGQNKVAWDLIARKMLGYIIVFDWFDHASYDIARKNIDFIGQRFEAPLIIAADIKDKPLPVKKAIIDPYISFSGREKFTFCNSASVTSIKSVFASLIDIAINYAN
jgi:hypothetical protein